MSPAPLLQAAHIYPGHTDYDALLTWPFPTDPFYAAQVLDLLRDDVPHRALFGMCFVFLYRDSAGTAVGFGTLEVASEYHSLTNGLDHAYIPVLAVHPDHNGKGYGKWIVEHLVSEAVLFHQSLHGLSDSIFLDVYQANTPAIGLYEKCKFETLNATNPIPDPKHNNEPYLVMARKLA